MNRDNKTPSKNPWRGWRAPAFIAGAAAAVASALLIARGNGKTGDE